MENYNRSDKAGTSTPRKILGFKALSAAIVIIGLGVMLLLKNMDILDERTSDIVFSWPMLIVAIGFLNLGGKSTWFGILVLLTGGFFLTGKIFEDQFSFEFEKLFWPIIIIAIGLMIIFFSTGKYFKRRRYSKTSENQNRLEEIQVFGGGERIVNSDAFEGGEMINVFGGSKIDLSRAKLAPGKHQIEFISVF